MSPSRVLIVDDQELFRRSLRTVLLSSPHWQVCGEAVDGVEAVEKAKLLQPNVVLMDVSMPRMDGLEAARIIQTELPECSVVIVSQNDPEVVRTQARDVNACGFVIKTDVFHSLIPTLEKLKGWGVSAGSGSHNGNGGSAAPGWLAGGGLLGQLIREHDWSNTPLGPLHNWPQSLKTSVNLILNSRHPMWIGWGPEMTFLYNDAYISVLSLAKHPKSLGRPAPEVWPEIWHICGPLADKVFEKGEASFFDDVRLFMSRGNFLEETFYSFSYSPIHDQFGKVEGLFCPSTETTSKNLNARRLRTLSALSGNALIAKSAEEACASSFAALAKNPDDVPFALLYLLDDDGQIRLNQDFGTSEGIAKVSPWRISLDDAAVDSQFWCMKQVLQSGRAQIISLQSLDSLPTGPADQRVSEAIVLPVTSGQHDRAFGFLIAGVNPTRQLDTEYRTFFDLVASQVAAVIQNASAAEEERRRADALAEIDRAKTAFFSNVSHEFRTPLTLMLGPVEDLLARSHTDLSPAAKTQLELVNRNGSRLLRLVNTLLDFSRIEAGRMQASYQATDLAAFTTELASAFCSATEKAGLRLEVDCPPLAEPVFVDCEMWEKIVLNLLSNAFKFTFNGEIGVSLTRVGNSVELCVRDTGVGIPANELPRLFDRFHRVQDTRSRTHEGSGIGLALVQELVRIHSGSIRVESMLGAGSSFFVTMPMGSSHLAAGRINKNPGRASSASSFVEEALRWCPDAETTSSSEDLPDVLAALAPAAPIADAYADSVSGHRPRILIADDNADMRQYLVRLLSERYDAKAVPDGQAALKAVQAQVPDLVLSDVMMPELDGFGLLRHLRSDPATSTIPIILLSARAGEEARVEGVERGADDYLIKPFSARELLARVQTHTELARARKQNEVALRQRSEQVESLLNVAPLGVYLVDSNLRIQHVNPSARAAFGNISDLVGRELGEVLHVLWPKPYADELVTRFRHTLETGEPYFVPEKIEERADRGVREVYEWQISRISLPDGGNGVVCFFRDISRMVEAREAIAESQERLNRALEAGELGVWEMDVATHKAWQSPQHARIFGYAEPPAGWNLQGFLDHVVADDRVQVEQAIQHAIDTLSDLNFECRIRRADNAERWIWAQGRVEAGSQGKPTLMKGMVRDITEHKRAEELTRQHRERFDLVAQASEVGFWFCDLPFEKLNWDDRVKEHFWLPPDAEVDIDLFYNRLHPDDRERTRQAIAGSIANRTHYDIEYRTVSRDGGEKWIRAIGQTFYDGAGVPNRFDGITLDITDRKRADAALQRITLEAIAATAMFQAVFEQTPVFAGIMTTEGVLTAANRLCLDSCGYREEEVIGKPFWNTAWWRLSPDNQEKIRAATAQAARGTPYREVLVYHQADGTERLADFSLHPIRDQKGKILFLHPTGVDITDLKSVEERYRTLAETLEVQVRNRTEELEQRNHEVLTQSEQLRELSHSLMQLQDNERRYIARELHDSAGQILTVLGMNLASIARQAEKIDPQLAREVEEGQQMVQELTQEIRTTSYLLHPPLLDETGLCEALQVYTAGLKERSDLDIALDVASDLGRPPREMELVIFRIVQECITNIHRHSGSKVAIIRLARKSYGIWLEIQDHGKGISPQRLVEIQLRGAGVGMRGIRERVLQFGGQMTIQSDSGGTKIGISLPLSKSEHSHTIGYIQQPSNAQADMQD